ncbi:hypothetical protein [Enterococcus sp. BWR-S5]|uniref:hypothetical protein n=1 Tax=Enterococcus sp. BWR-S5 TaxID=2787714 RepID=UPI001923D638|nr:hypothetical protein [Enterococcus sp. BWR-S5]MBL1223920.1 hypothetical protein [Enterococcus sp. BWR-S5]
MSAKQSRTPNTISIIILDKENVVKYVPPIRRWTKEPISEIRRKILNSEFILISEQSKDPQSLIDLKSHILDLEAMGANLRIIMNTSGYIEEISLEMITTFIKRRKEIDKEVDEIWDLEARAMEEDEK